MMKNIILVLLVSLMVWGCEEESNLDPSGNWELSEPAVKTFNEGNTLVLDESKPQEIITFNWEAAVSSERYGVYYTVLIDSLDAEDSSAPILKIDALEGGKALSATTTYMELNDALYMTGFKAGEDLELTWTVVANCLSKQTQAGESLKVNRYDDDKLFLAGAATEVGNDASNAILMYRKVNGANEKLHLFESYTLLKANEPFMVYNGRSENAVQYGLSDDGKLVKGGSPIVADTESVYRVVVDFDQMTIELNPIERLGIIGAPLENGWDSDEMLAYKGMGVWQSDISFVSTGSFIFRTNDNWSYNLKKVVGSTNTIMSESFAGDQGIDVEDFSMDEPGYYTLTVNLVGEGYTLDVQKAPESRMYLIVNGSSHELTMVGDGIFTTTEYLALQPTDALIINTESDGSGMSYSTSDAIESGSGDKVEGTVALSNMDATFSTSFDQAFGFTVDVNAGELTWHHYNIKLFHWDDDAEGGWDDKVEVLMTYSHPYTFTATTDLQADFESKFFSPWDVQFGADDPNALAGSMTNGGGSNFTNISASGSYDVTIVVAGDYATGTYEFKAR